MCACVCVCVCVSAHARARVRVCVPVCAPACAYARVRAHVRVCARAHACTCVHTPGCAHPAAISALIHSIPDTCGYPPGDLCHRRSTHRLPKVGSADPGRWRWRRWWQGWWQGWGLWRRRWRRPGRRGGRHDGTCRCMDGGSNVLNQCIKTCRHHGSNLQTRSWRVCKEGALWPMGNACLDST